MVKKRQSIFGGFGVSISHVQIKKDYSEDIEKFVKNGGKIKQIDSVGAQGCFNPTAMKRPKKERKND